MYIAKVYTKPNKPEFYIVIKQDKEKLLVNYPTDKPYRKRSAKWIDIKEVYIEWVRLFKEDL